MCKLAFSAAFYSCIGRQSLTLPNLKTCLVRELQVSEPPGVEELGDSQRNVSAVWHDKQ